MVNFRKILYSTERHNREVSLDNVQTRRTKAFVHICMIAIHGTLNHHLCTINIQVSGQHGFRRALPIGNAAFKLTESVFNL